MHGKRMAICLIISVCLTRLVSPQLNTTLPPDCQLTNYTTSYTQCELTFLFCYAYRQLRQCVLNKCQRYVRATDCLTVTSFVLSEKDCYQQCCGNSTFDEQGCDTFNQNKLNTSSKMDSGLITILFICIGFLILVVGVFIVKKMRCFEKQQPWRMAKYNLKWKKVTYQDQKCDHCNAYGPMLITPCGHKFHVSCFQENCKDLTCPKCQLKIQGKLQIFCFHCRQKAFKVKIRKVQELSDIIAEAKALHFDLCPRQIRSNANLLQTLPR